MKIFKILVLFLLPWRMCLCCQAVNSTNNFDSLGYRDGYWEEWLDYQLNITESRKKAVFKRLIYYDHGFKASIFSQSNKLDVYMQGASTIVVPKGNCTPDIPLIDGFFFSLNEKGDTIRKEFYRAGLPIARFTYRHTAYGVLSQVIDFESQHVSSPFGCELYREQSGSGEFLFHELFDKMDDRWGFYPYNDDYFEKKGVQVIAFRVDKGTTPVTTEAKFSVNKDIYLILERGRYCEFWLKADSCRFQEIGKSVAKKNISLKTNQNIGIQVNFENGFFQSIEACDYRKAVEAITALSLKKNATPTWDRPEFVVRERPFSTRKQVKMKRKMLS